jgi:hypothetical protein
MMFSYRRRLLYNEVWNNRLCVAAARYGISEDQMRKACLSFGVRLPGAKYWQRLDEGRPLTVRPLSRFINRSTIDFGMEQAERIEYWDWDFADAMFKDSFNVPPIYVVPPGIFGDSRLSKIYEGADLAGWAAMDGSTPYDLYRNSHAEYLCDECTEAVIEVDAENRECLGWLRKKHIGLSSPLGSRLLLADLRYRCAEREIASSTFNDLFRYVNAFAAVLGAHDIECKIRLITRYFVTGSALCFSKPIRSQAP